MTAIAPRTSALATAARRYAEEGLVLVPLHSVRDGACSCGNPACRTPGKHPRTPNGLKDASRDVAVVESWWQQWPAANIGCLPGPSGFAVVDVDGPQGAATAQALGLLAEPTATVETGRGEHRWYKHPGGTIGNEPLGPELDVRADRGYCILPPSVHPSGKRYRWAGDVKLRDAAVVPPAVLQRWRAPTPTTRAAPVSNDVEAFLNVPEGQRNTMMTKFVGLMFAKLRDPALVAVAAEGLNARWRVPLDLDEVRAIVRSIGQKEAERRASDPLGDTVEEALEAALPLPLSLGAPPAVDPPAFAIDHILPAAEITLIVGDSGFGKTSIALAIAVAKATGCPLFGAYRVAAPGPVLIVSEEDDAGVLYNRAAAIARGLGLSPEDGDLSDLHVLALGGANLSAPRWQAHLEQLVRDQRIELALYDPLADLIDGSEDSATDARPVKRFWRSLLRLGCAVVAVHHVAKPVEGRRKRDRIRGSSSWKDAARVIWWLERTEAGVRLEALKNNRVAQLPEVVVLREVETDPANPALWQRAVFRLADGAAPIADDRVVRALQVIRDAAIKPNTAELGHLLRTREGLRLSTDDFRALCARLKTEGLAVAEPTGKRNERAWRLQIAGEALLNTVHRSQGLTDATPN